MPNINLLPALDRMRSPCGQPFFDFGKIPHDAARRKGKTAGKLAALLHAEYRAVGQRHHLLELVAAYCSGQTGIATLGHRQILQSTLMPYVETVSFSKPFRFSRSLAQNRKLSALPRWLLAAQRPRSPVIWMRFGSRLTRERSVSELLCCQCLATKSPWNPSGTA